MGLTSFLYGAYERRLLRELPSDRLPRHVGVMLDGNRRWAKQKGADAKTGHRAGAENIEPFLVWSEEAGIEIVKIQRRRKTEQREIAEEHRKPVGK